MKLTIITINRNNATGLEKTMQSVFCQTCQDFEYVVVDGASTDGSIDVIRSFETQFGERLKWVSEPDKGIYNAMNKGIKMASGDYLEFLNSGDCLVANDVVERMFDAMTRTRMPSILYGNMLKDMPGGVFRDRSFAGKEITFHGFYDGTLNHSPAYIKKDLFNKYGFYDETLKIVSDWKWYLLAIILGEEKPVYADIDVTLFDMTGISETNPELLREEREKVLEEFICYPIWADYKKMGFQIKQMERLMRHPWAYRIVWFIERCLFKLEKWRNNHKNRVQRH